MSGKCEACGGLGWLEALPEDQQAPAGLVYVQRCDACKKYHSDVYAAIAYGTFVGEDEFGYLCSKIS